MCSPSPGTFEGENINVKFLNFSAYLETMYSSIYFSNFFINGVPGVIKLLSIMS